MGRVEAACSCSLLWSPRRLLEVTAAQAVVEAAAVGLGAVCKMQSC